MRSPHASTRLVATATAVLYHSVTVVTLTESLYLMG